ncbi:MAG: LysM peptidoglycan-binding domain-containing protein, partial [Butyrivibrio sp.]|nr:LysM peptidoglycan-binding domain-containing protein [Butyrivibrio sp.]
AGPLQVSTLLTGGGEVNIKCNAIVDLMAAKSHSDSLICDVTAAPPDYGRIKNLPGIVGYITRAGDTLWNIAKEYCTTIKDIMETNGLASEDIKPGMKLIIIKKC